MLRLLYRQVGDFSRWLWRDFFPYCMLLFVVCVIHDKCEAAPLQAAIVVDADTGEELYSMNADQQTQPASLTKMMSLLIAFRAIKMGIVKPHTLMRVSKYAASQSPCSLGLKAGSCITFRNVVLAMVTKSANDASVVLAEHLAGSEGKFVKMMNKEAKRLKMHSTVFLNASGWKNSCQLTTARDMAKLSRALLLEYPKYFRIFSTKNFSYMGQRYQNHNTLLGKIGGFIVDGIKTGFVTASGYNIAVSARKGSERLIAIMLGGKTAQKRNATIEWLLSNGFNRLSMKKRSRQIQHLKRKTLGLKTLPTENNKKPIADLLKTQILLEKTHATKNISTKG